MCVCRAVKALFERHIDDNKGSLDEALMRKLLDQLRLDLGIK